MWTPEYPPSSLYFGQGRSKERGQYAPADGRGTSSKRTLSPKRKSLEIKKARSERGRSLSPRQTSLGETKANTSNGDSLTLQFPTLPNKTPSSQLPHPKPVYQAPRKKWKWSPLPIKTSTSTSAIVSLTLLEI